MFIEKFGLNKKALENKVAVITGSGRGIGKELARSLAWLGAKVVIAEIELEGKKVEELIIKEKGEALFVQTDVSKEKDIKKLEEQVIKTFGTIDILVNNAIIYSAGSLKELPMEAWDKAYNVNIRGAVYAIKSFLPYMLLKNEGVIVNVTSAGGTPYMAPYFASKAALTSIAESLAAEIDETNVSVFTFGPGMVDTPGIQEAAKLLAPRFGMTEEEFKNMGVNPGYEGLMPADHCAAGWAYTIVNAKDYHGQIADPFTPLLKLGLIKQKKANFQNPDLKIKKKGDEDFNSIDVLIEKVKKLLFDVKKETDNLGLFARKWVEKTFARRCGMKIDKFIQLIEELDDTINRSDLNINWYSSSLAKLASHFDQNIEDAKGWIEDPEELEAAIQVLQERGEIVQKLIYSLEIH